MTHLNVYPDFQSVRVNIDREFEMDSVVVAPSRWQGLDVHTKPEMAMHELLDISFQVANLEKSTVDSLVQDIKPHILWADVHFDERVGGEPLNPGESWKVWPWAHSADKFRVHDGQYDHTYMERFWPKYAGRSKDGKIPEYPAFIQRNPHSGIRFEYGDLNDLISHLKNDPSSRQAYLPVWFPEDGTCHGRKPCTLGYHFLLRNGFFHHTYYIRSCDFIRHWADDCYLAMRLHLWILDRLRDLDPNWIEIKPGRFTMHIVSLHMFANDWIQRYGKENSSVRYLSRR